MKSILSKEIYHGCDGGYNDGTQILIKSNGSCAYPISNLFWKQPKDVYTAVKTRSQTKKSIIATHYYMDLYFDQIQNKNKNNTKLNSCP